MRQLSSLCPLDSQRRKQNCLQRRNYESKELYTNANKHNCTLPHYRDQILSGMQMDLINLNLMAFMVALMGS